MKKLIVLFLSLVVLFSCNSDDSDDVGTVELRFQLNYQDAPLIMNRDYTYDQWTLFFTRFHFFVSHLNLMSSNGDFPVHEYEKISFTEANVDSTVAAEGVVYTYEDVKVGTYNGIRFNLGLDPKTNEMSPSDYTATHTLGNPADYWAPWNSYIFTKTEGSVMLEEGPAGFAFHTGGDQSYRQLMFSDQLSVRANQTTHLTFEIDLFDVLQFEGEPIDLNEHRTAHNEGDLFLMEEIMDNLRDAFKQID